MIPSLAQDERLMGMQMQPNGLYGYSTVTGDSCVSSEDKNCVRAMLHYDIMKEGKAIVNAILKEAGFEFDSSEPIISADHKDDRQVEFYQQVDWKDED